MQAGLPSPMRIVLLGASGFVGRAVLRAMANRKGEKEARLLVHRSLVPIAYDFASPYQGSMTTLPVDLFPSAPHVVIHCANKQIDQDGSGFEENIQGIHALSRAVNRHTKAILYASSFSVYGEGAQRGVSEDAPLAPQTALARSRVECEAKLAEASAASGIPVLALRTRFIIGDGDKFFLPGLIKMACGGMQLGDESQRFSLIDVDDYADVMLDIAHKALSSSLPPTSFSAFNVAYETPVSLTEIREVLQDIFNLRMPRHELDISERYLQSLEGLPVASINQLAQRLRLVGYDHYGQVKKLAAFLGSDLLKADPRLAVRKAAAVLARRSDWHMTIS